MLIVNKRSAIYLGPRPLKDLKAISRGLEIDSEFNRKPVQRFENWSNVLSSLGVCDYSRSSILDKLQLFYGRSALQ